MLHNQSKQNRRLSGLLSPKNLLLCFCLIYICWSSLPQHQLQHREYRQLQDQQQQLPDDHPVQTVAGIDAHQQQQLPEADEHPVQTVAGVVAGIDAHQQQQLPDNHPVQTVAGVDANRTHEASEIFNTIAKTNKWGDKESISGDGSGMGNTNTFRSCLMTWLVKYGIKEFVDCPCGDGNWQGAIPGITHVISPGHPLPYVRYRGFDISELAISHAKLKNKQNANMSFAVLDLSARVPPKADAIMIRDAIQHVPLKMGWAMLVNAKASGTRYLIISTYDYGSNKEVKIGGYYCNNVHQKPFSLPSPLETCSNYDRISIPCNKAKAACLSSMHLIDMDQWQPSLPPQ